MKAQLRSNPDYAAASLEGAETFLSQWTAVDGADPAMVVGSGRRKDRW